MIKSNNSKTIRNDDGTARKLDKIEWNRGREMLMWIQGSGIQPISSKNHTRVKVIPPRKRRSRSTLGKMQICFVNRLFWFISHCLTGSGELSWPPTLMIQIKRDNVWKIK